MTTIHNAKYTSKIIQNDVLDCLAEMVRSEIIEDVKDIMADETKDVSKKEQISFILRYYYSGVIKVSFFILNVQRGFMQQGLQKK